MLSDNYFWLKPDYDKSKPIIMYGFGLIGSHNLKRILDEGIEVKAIFDLNPKYHGYIKNIPVLSPDRIKDFDRNLNVFISTVRHKYTLRRMFEKLGFINIFYNYEPEMHCIEYILANKEKNKKIIIENDNQIKKVRKLISDSKSLEIFDAALDAWGNGNWERLEATAEKEVILPEDIFTIGEHEVLAECGAYDGGGIRMFIGETKNRYDYIYGFEPDEVTYTVASRAFEYNNTAKLEMHRLAVCDVDGTINFSEDNSKEGAKIVKIGGVSVPATTLDTFFIAPGRKHPTLIRMDIEGAEVSALYGAKNIIKEYMPKLSISAYHKLTDYWKVPLAIAEISESKYEIYFKHFLCWFDTMCFARPKV